MDREERVIEAQEAAERAAPAPIADSKSLIAVTQLPIIEERLRDYKAEIEAIVAEAKTMVATPDTIQAVKAKRAELRKQFDDLDKRRIAVKNLILEPYERFNKVYKDCVEMPFKDADATLKATVDGFEGELKAKAMERLQAHYTELCALQGIDCLTFDEALRRSGVKVGMADTRTKEPRKAMDAMAEYVGKVACGLDAVRKMEDSAEIMVEFKKTLDAGQAAAIVQERKRRVREAEEAEAKRREETARQREMTAKVEALTPTPVAPPDCHIYRGMPEEAAPPPEADFPSVIGFHIYPKSAEEYRKVLPALRQLKQILVEEGIQYGK